MQRAKTLWQIAPQSIQFMGIQKLLLSLLLVCMAWIPGIPAWVYAAEPIINAAVNTDETLLATVQGKKATVWEIATGKKLYDLTIPETSWTFKSEKRSGKIRGVIFDPQNNWIAISGNANKIYFFDIISKKINEDIPITTLGMGDLCVSPNGNLIAGITVEGLYVWDVKSLQLRFKDENFEDNEGPLRCVFYDNDNLITVSLDNNIRIYLDGKLIERKKIDDRNGSFNISLNPNKKGFAIAHSNGVKVGSFNPIQIDDYKVGHVLSNEDVRGVAWSKDGERLYFGGMRKSLDGVYYIFIWDTKNPKQLTAIERGGGFIQKIISLKNGNIVVATGEPSWLVLNKNGDVVQFHRTNYL